ncbi:MAG: hypothetical protein QUV05_07565 [Phycisphaerae bacterium]|nr:hypothetical protein [Phycisphaerae bacterium]
MLHELLLICQLAAPSPGDYFKIQVVDAQTGRGVPLVELKTTHNVCYYTDSNGLVAFHEPGLMDQRVFFTVKSHGYEFPKDGFGMSGTALEVKPGGSAVLKIKRVNIAERLYRLTGGGIYRDTVLLGLKPPIREPVLHGRVVGCDSIQGILYHGRLFWMWGDTGWPAYPLGNFHMTGATSALPSAGGLDPDIGIDYDYFLRDNGFVKEMAPHSGPGPVWLDGLITLPDEAGRERLYAMYARVNNAMETQERGLMLFDDKKELFEKVVEFDLKAPVKPAGHPFRCEVDGKQFVYYDPGYPFVRIAADARLLTDSANYEAYTPLVDGSSKESPKLDRRADGTLRYTWKKDTPGLSPADFSKMIKDGVLKQEEALIQTADVETGKPFQLHGSSVYWNEYRRRWVMIASEIMGTSMLGELWYLEADTPLGPWVYGRKIITHDKYSFYNPKQHPVFAKDNGRIIYFEGTYTAFVSGAPVLTPWYDYNQIMYKLDLGDERLALPAPVYELSADPGKQVLGRWDNVAIGKDVPTIAFFAPDRPFPGSIPVYQQRSEEGSALLVAGERTSKSGVERPLFYALPSDVPAPPAGTVPLYEIAREDGRQRLYPTTAEAPAAGYKRSDTPLCFVWRSPYGGAPPLPPKERIDPAPPE